MFQKQLPPSTLHLFHHTMQVVTVEEDWWLVSQFACLWQWLNNYITGKCCAVQCSAVKCSHYLFKDINCLCVITFFCYFRNTHMTVGTFILKFAVTCSKSFTGFWMSSRTVFHLMAVWKLCACSLHWNAFFYMILWIYKIRNLPYCQISSSIFHTLYLEFRWQG